MSNYSRSKKNLRISSTSACRCITMRLSTTRTRRSATAIVYKLMSCNLVQPCNILLILKVTNPLWSHSWHTLTRFVRRWWLKSVPWPIFPTTARVSSKMIKRRNKNLNTNSKWWNVSITLRSSGRRSRIYARVTIEWRFSNEMSSWKRPWSMSRIKRNRLRTWPKCANSCKSHMIRLLNMPKTWR